tara:strand:+ start:795 stop:1073 length:279 start_codon:yes stop_codon:yes gene_type:complete
MTRQSVVLIDTIERFPTYALQCLFHGDCEGLEYNEAKAVADIQEKFNATHEGVTYDQDAAGIEFTNDPEFGLPCEAMPVNVWGRARDVVSNS